MNLSVAAEEFLAYLQHEKGCSPLTITASRSDLTQFLQFLREQRVPATVSKPATIARRLASLESLFAYLHDCEYIQANPLGRVSTPKLRRRVPNYLTPDECRRLLKATDENSSSISRSATEPSSPHCSIRASGEQSCWHCD
jgi:site-specific recombinase XerD